MDTKPPRYSEDNYAESEASYEHNNHYARFTANGPGGPGARVHRGSEAGSGMGENIAHFRDYQDPPEAAGPPRPLHTASSERTPYLSPSKQPLAPPLSNGGHQRLASPRGSHRGGADDTIITHDVSSVQIDVRERASRGDVIIKCNGDNAEYGTYHKGQRDNKQVTSRSIWEYLRLEHSSSRLTPQDVALLRFCMARVAQLTEAQRRSMRLTVYTQHATTANPVFYSGNKHIFEAIMLSDDQPEFIHITDSKTSSCRCMTYIELLYFLVSVLVIIGLVIFAYIAIGRGFDEVAVLLTNLSGALNATINIVGNSKSDLTFDDLDININMQAGSSDR